MHWSILLLLYIAVPRIYPIKLIWPFINVQPELHIDFMYPKHADCLYTETVKRFHV